MLQDAIRDALDAVERFGRPGAAITDREVARTDLETALDEIAVAAAECAASDGYDNDIEKLVLKLRGNRLFVELLEFSTALVDAGVAIPKVRLQRAQAAIECKEFPIAMAELHGLDVRGEPEGIRRDARGLLGRVHKQFYVDTADTAAGGTAKRTRANYLRAAIKEYASQYVKIRGDIAKAYYHGVNLIALVWRAEHDNVDVTAALRGKKVEHTTAAEIAYELLADLVPHARQQQAKADPDLWAIASVGEALLAVEPHEADAAGWGTPEQWYADYAARCTDHFMLHGSARQLEEVWLVNSNDPLRGLSLSILRAGIIRRNGATRLGTRDLELIENSRAGVGDDEGSYEKIIQGIAPSSAERPLKIAYFSTAIGRVRDRISGKTIGTGFLFDGNSLEDARFAGRKLFMTCAHTVSNNKKDLRSRIRAMRLQDVDFECRRHLTNNRHAISEPLVLAGATIIWNSPHDELDATIIELSGDVAPLPTLPLMPFDAVGLPDPRVDTAFIMGYPQGGDLTLTDKNNAVRTDKNGKLAYGWRNESRKHHLFVHYHSSTERGSSGSPVFDADLNGVYAMHHRGPDGDHVGPNIDKGDEGQRIQMLNSARGPSGRLITWTANEGILIKSIIEQARLDLAQSRPQTVAAVQPPAPTPAAAPPVSEPKPVKKGIVGRFIERASKSKKS